jgi:hypothetical protein
MTNPTDKNCETIYPKPTLTLVPIDTFSLKPEAVDYQFLFANAWQHYVVRHRKDDEADHQYKLLFAVAYFDGVASAIGALQQSYITKVNPTKEDDPLSEIVSDAQLLIELTVSRLKEQQKSGEAT